MKRIAASVAATLLVLAVAEGVLRAAYWGRNAAVDYVPLPYVIGQVYGPVPPWVDGIRLLEMQDGILWRGRANVRRKYVDVFSPVARDEDRTALLRRFLPILPASLHGNPTWEVALDSEGFRDVDLPRAKGPSTFRIVCLGDSWTFGANVAPGDSYPRRLEALLHHELPTGEFEVLNLGVLGYSSYQGLTLLRRRVLELEPDVLLVGFGMNDAAVAHYHDAEAATHPVPQPAPVTALERLELYRLLRYAADRRAFHAPSLGEHLVDASGDSPDASYLVPGASGLRDYARLDGQTRVSVAEYATNLVSIVETARGRGVGVVFLYTDLAPNSPYRAAMRDVAARMDVPLVDCSALLGEARRRVEEELEARLDLRPSRAELASAGPATTVLRVRVETPVAKAVYLAAPALGAVSPNTVPMYDDGTHGDQRAGDGVWSYAAAVAPGTKVFYVYTNSGTPGVWDGLDVPEIRAFATDATAGTVYRPIDTFGRVYLQADSWHTDAAGYDLIARAVLARLRGVDALTTYLEGQRARTAGEARR